MWKLHNVRLILDLKRNLITLWLDEEAYISIFYANSWKVNKGAMVIAYGRKSWCHTVKYMISNTIYWKQQINLILVLLEVQCLITFFKLVLTKGKWHWKANNILKSRNKENSKTRMMINDDRFMIDELCYYRP
ncbi:hypothetical protein MA16_Dca026646 [Dendrobium catenatum]|uniref:Uncharacterized protein n=1 Tax=Dendrobium catenatum TaxID=906689 RepID=A0A2I0WZZ3_9ASPA|nr:hypothetical protein MA16_Dca026646 [Dendrobium catenatum]